MEQTQQNTPQVDVQKVIEALLRQVTESARRIAILEAFLDQTENTVK